MDKELIDLIFTHIKGLGQGGGELLKWYLLAHYGYNLLIALSWVSALYLVVSRLKQIFCLRGEKDNLLQDIAIRLGRSDFDIEYYHQREALLHSIDRLKENQKD
jgi:hypothetical protein